ncbi:cyclophilin-like fold protein [Hymenobacter jeollabukensis]|uniref:Cyclophilin-like domain-containing protein n=1 Tax=Hymenobacter jeollabukensis TaxID=2025313 RepID=A0A5R8WNC6_9BACT|nr:cyclophilin-like fold protein [Hymenobacter jeollabukensis]TLM91215.1 hypothetical protein FDY95_16625 [Hymenobacter jeollabukensis]
METLNPPKLRISMGAQVLTATLYDNAAARDFAALLPLTLSLQDYAGTEKISDLPARLSTQGAPTGHTPAAGDLAYYAPWGNLALFYRPFRHSAGLVVLGKLEGDVEVFRAAGPVMVKLELLP